MNLSKYEGKIVRVFDKDGYIFTGYAAMFSPEYGLHEFGREEESVLINYCQIFESDIREIMELPDISVQRITDPHAREEVFHAWLLEKDAMVPDPAVRDRERETKLTVITDKGYPIAWGVMEPMEEGNIRLDYVTVKKEYRNLGIAAMTISECEAWAEALHFAKMTVFTPKRFVKFWDLMLYEAARKSGEETPGIFRMEKIL